MRRRVQDVRGADGKMVRVLKEKDDDEESLYEYVGICFYSLLVN